MENVQVNYLRRIFTILLLVVVTTIICLGNEILFPVVLAFILGVLIRPVDAFLQNKWRFPKFLSVFITVIIVLAFFAGILFLIGVQLKDFFNDLPTLEKNMTKVIHDLEKWINQTFGVSTFQQEKIVKENLKPGNLLSKESFGSITGVLMYFILIPLYLFLILFYRSLLLGFLMKLVPSSSTEKMQIVVNKIKVVIRMYILGLLLQIAVVASLTTLGLWLIGVKYALFLGLITALLNLIPYVGILIANFLSCLISLSNNPSLEQSVLGVLAVIGIVQFLDNNIISPRIVGSQVRINALASILSVIIGGTLAGVPGMFLAIPLTAIMKVIFDAVPNLQPYGFLLGDELPKPFFWTKKKNIGNEKAATPVSKESKKTGKEEEKSVVKSASKTDSKPAVKSDSKPAVKSDSKPAAKPASKPTGNRGTKPSDKTKPE